MVSPNLQGLGGDGENKGKKLLAIRGASLRGGIWQKLVGTLQRSHIKMYIISSLD